MSTPQVTMYATGWCGYCARARRLLSRKGIAYTEIDAEEPEKRAEMIARSGRRTVPQIFVGEQHIGDSDELQALEERGEFDKLFDTLLGTQRSRAG